MGTVRTTDPDYSTSECTKDMLTGQHRRPTPWLDSHAGNSGLSSEVTDFTMGSYMHLSLDACSY